jgi:hypothetical protein
MKKREYGEIPNWAKRGPITLANYSLRAELYCKLRGRTEHPTIERGTTACERWQSYFQYHLGGYPQAMWMLIEGRIKEMTVPEDDPEAFDQDWPGLAPTATLVDPPLSRPRALPPIPPGQDYFSMVKKYGIPVERPKQAWHSLDELVAALKNGTFKDGPSRAAHSETAETVRAKFNLSQEQWDAIPDAPPRAP